MSYMEKKTSKRQTTIVTLSDHNKQEIRNIQLQRQVMEEEFDDKKKGTCSLIESMADVSYNFFYIYYYWYCWTCLRDAFIFLGGRVGGGIA